MTRPAKILPGPRCGWPDNCSVKSVDHAPEPGTRRIWGYHDVQCQVPNPRPGPHLDGYPECGLTDGHAGGHDYVRHAAEAAAGPPRALQARELEAIREEPGIEAGL